MDYRFILTLGRTINIGNYESMKLEVSLEGRVNDHSPEELNKAREYMTPRIQDQLDRLELQELEARGR